MKDQTTEAHLLELLEGFRSSNSTSVYPTNDTQRHDCYEQKEDVADKYQCTDYPSSSEAGTFFLTILIIMAYIVSHLEEQSTFQMNASNEEESEE